jgi:hypothetical protein
LTMSCHISPEALWLLFLLLLLLWLFVSNSFSRWGIRDQQRFFFFFFNIKSGRKCRSIRCS